MNGKSSCFTGNRTVVSAENEIERTVVFNIAADDTFIVTRNIGYQHRTVVDDFTTDNLRASEVERDVFGVGHRLTGQVNTGNKRDGSTVGCRGKRFIQRFILLATN